MSNNRNCVLRTVRHPNPLCGHFHLTVFFTKGKPPFELISSELSINLNIDKLVGEWSYGGFYTI